jgi:hypothetical protein
VVLADVQPQPLAALTGSGVVQLVGEANVLASIDDALARAAELLAALEMV